MGYLPRRTAFKKWNQPERKRQERVELIDLSYRYQSKRGGPSKPFGIRHRATGFGGLLCCVLACIGAVLTLYTFIPQFWYAIYILCDCILEICNLLLTLQGLQLKDCLECQKFWTLLSCFETGKQWGLLKLY